MSDTDAATLDTSAAEVVTETAPAAPTTSIIGGATATEAAAPDNAPSQVDGDAAKPEAEGEGKDGQADKPAPITAESYGDFTIPEGLTVDQGQLDQFKSLFADLGLNKDQAQQLVSKRAEIVQAEAAVWHKQQEAWVTEVMADPEVGGADMAQKMTLVGKTLDQFGDPNMRAVFDGYGLGNHPAFVRMFYRIGKAMAEDKPVGVHAPSQGHNPSEKTLYPTMNK
jgi:hypothetical protein